MNFTSLYKSIKFIFLSLILLSPILTVAQDNSVDSLKKLLNTQLHDTSRCRVLMILAETAPDNEWPGFNKKLFDLSKAKYEAAAEKGPLKKKFANFLGYAYSNLAFIGQFDGNYDEAMENLYNGNKFYTIANNKQGNLSITISLGAMHQRKNNLIKALEFYEQAAQLAVQLNNPQNELDCYNNIGNVLKQQGNIPNAINYFEKGLRIAEKNNFKGGMSDCLHSLAHIYKSIGDIKKSKEYAFKSLQIREKLKDTHDLSFSLDFVGGFYLEAKDYKTALNYFERSLKLREQLGDKRSLAMSYNSLGACYERMHELDKSLELFNKSLAINTQIGDKEGIANGLENIGKNYLKRNNTAKAYELFKKEFELANEIGYVSLQREAAQMLYEVCKIKGDAKQALTYYEQYNTFKDKLVSEENKKALMSSEFKLAYEKKEQSLKLEQEKKEIIHQQETLRKQSDLDKQKAITYGFMAGFILLIALIVLVFRNLKQSKIANAIISEKKLEVENKNLLIEAKQKEILDSINYAKRIQYTLLAHVDFLNENLPEHFIYFNPKDIVSGDFYWATKVLTSDQRELMYLAVCDSTGHGVPGAFMSLLNISFLNEAINEKEIIEPNKVFEHVRKKLIENISKEGQKDGFDGVLICLEKVNALTEKASYKITYAAANNAPVIVRGQDIIPLPNDRMPVGMGEKKDLFQLYSTDLLPNDMLYIFTDGFADQFGGEKGKKFKYKQLTEKLQQMSTQPMSEQNTRLKSIFENWRGNLEQIDDVCVIGIRG